MNSIIPSRRFTGGRPPGITGVKDPMCKFRWKWDKHPEDYTKEEERLILSKVVELAVKTTFQTHFYKWGKSIYK